MPPSDTSEKGLESLIVSTLTGIRRAAECYKTSDRRQGPGVIRWSRLCCG